LQVMWLLEKHGGRIRSTLQILLIVQTLGDVILQQIREGSIEFFRVTRTQQSLPGLIRRCPEGVVCGEIIQIYHPEIIPILVRTTKEGKFGFGTYEIIQRGFRTGRSAGQNDRFRWDSVLSSHHQLCCVRSVPDKIVLTIHRGGIQDPTRSKR